MTTTTLRRSTRLGELMRRFTLLVTPLLGPLAGRRFFTIWARLNYRGRRSGTRLLDSHRHRRDG